MAIRVLAVDDELDILRLVQIKLRKAGFEVFVAHDGEEGLAQALALMPDVIIADVLVPKLNGNAMVAALKQQLGERAPIAIMLTAKGQNSDILEGLASGADDYVVKPFSPSELIERLNVALLKNGRMPSDH
jgi:DNA-binding response OmpR family regulator